MSLYTSAFIFADNFLFYVSHMYELEWVYRHNCSHLFQNDFNEKYEDAIEFYEQNTNEEILLFLDHTPFLWVEDSDMDYFYLFAMRVLVYFKRMPFSRENFIHLCVRLCSIASYFGEDKKLNTMDHAFQFVYGLTCKAMLFETF